MVLRRVALDIGAVDPSAALEAVARATTDDVATWSERGLGPGQEAS